LAVLKIKQTPNETQALKNSVINMIRMDVVAQFFAGTRLPLSSAQRKGRDAEGAEQNRASRGENKVNLREAIFSLSVLCISALSLR
jgi:hypothetical protein